tara:strand:- start:1 stop:129 length:129 start_codon:yes stop_codon:yes gene_type:complete
VFTVESGAKPQKLEQESAEAYLKMIQKKKQRQEEIQKRRFGH